ncbi:MAG: hypothetical protein HYT79_11375 [Elusimicrobia bacterium]|nr:hypothetical protein [Elusimicrobiota bacterium]
MIRIIPAFAKSSKSRGRQESFLDLIELNVFFRRTVFTGTLAMGIAAGALAWALIFKTPEVYFISPAGDAKRMGQNEAASQELARFARGALALIYEHEPLSRQERLTHCESLCAAGLLLKIRAEVLTEDSFRRFIVRKLTIKETGPRLFEAAFEGMSVAGSLMGNSESKQEAAVTLVIKQIERTAENPHGLLLEDIR